MDFLYSVLLGILQGLTEFLPVSSSGHLVLAQHFLGFSANSDVLFEVFLHLGTLVSVLVFFRRRIAALLVSLAHWKSEPQAAGHRQNRMLLLYLGIATLVTGLVYLAAGDFLESLFARPLIVALMLLITGLIVFIPDLVPAGHVSAPRLGLPRSALIGLVQGIAIIPGISRSGSTISASLSVGLSRRDASEFSFLLSIPAILGAILFNLKDLAALAGAQLPVYLAGFAAAFIVGYLVIAVLIKLILKARLRYFSYYCWAVGSVSAVLILLRK